MIDERIRYFSPAEFMILLELAEGPVCSLLSDGAPLEDRALTAAFTALFQRGLIRRVNGGFVLSESSRMFEEIRRAPWAVYISGRNGNTSLCYWTEGSLWLAELADVILAVQYRIRQLDRAGLERWLFDSGLLAPPALAAEDVHELEALLAEEPEAPPAQPLLRLEKHANGGPAVEVYEVYKRRGRWRIYGGGGNQDVYYTREALSDMLADCFGKEDYDCC